MNILQIHNYYTQKGGESSVMTAEKHLLEINNHCIFQLTADNRYFINYFHQKHKFYSQLAIIIEENKIDVAHVHNVQYIIGSDIYKYLSEKGIPIVQTCHNYRFLCSNGVLFDNSSKYCELCSKGNFLFSILKRCYKKSYLKSIFVLTPLKRARKHALSFVNQFIALSENAKSKFVLSGFPIERFAYKPNFSLNRSSRNVTDGQYALYLGRLTREKGVDLLVKAFRDLPFKLVIAGDGPLLAEIKKTASNNINFIGFVEGEAKEEVLANCSFIILPSIANEMFPMAIVEAAVYSKAVIASDVGGLSEIVINEKTGLIIPPNSISSLHASIIKMITERYYMSLGLNAFSAFKEKFSETINYNLLMEIYGAAIKNQHDIQGNA